MYNRLTPIAVRNPPPTSFNPPLISPRRDPTSFFFDLIFRPNPRPAEGLAQVSEKPKQRPVPSRIARANLLLRPPTRNDPNELAPDLRPPTHAATEVADGTHPKTRIRDCRRGVPFAPRLSSFSTSSIATSFLIRLEKTPVPPKIPPLRHWRSDKRAPPLNGRSPSTIFDKFFNFVCAAPVAPQASHPAPHPAASRSSGLVTAIDGLLITCVSIIVVLRLECPSKV